MTISAITIGGKAVDFDHVDCTITINHGRQDITATGAPSDALLNLVGFQVIPAEVGQTVNIQAYGTDRFTGTVTGVTLTHVYHAPGDYWPVMQVSAIGNLAALGSKSVGESGYSREYLAIRAANILDDTGLTYQATTDPAFEIEALAAKDGGYQALELLQQLCEDTGATLFDVPDGTILFESYSTRGYGYNPAHWADIDPAETWATIIGIWSDVYDRTEAAPQTIQLPHNAVVWSPVWRNDSSTVINDVTVTYGSSSSTSQTDSASITKYGRRAATLETELHKLSDAQRRAGDIIRAQAEARYALGNVVVQMSELPTLTKTQVLGLISGSRVTINDLPNPHPIEDYTGIVEGWTDSYTVAGHYLTLSLSDPRYSYLVLKWSEVTATTRWSHVSPTLQWYNVVNNSDLTP